MGSVSNVKPQNFQLGPMRVTYKGVDLGGTKGVSVGASYKTAGLMADQLGTEPVDWVITGETFSVKMALVEVKNKQAWETAFPFVKKVVNATDPTKVKLVFDSAVGSYASAKAGELVLHPLSNADADLSGDFKFPKAVALAEGAELKYGPEEQTVLEITFKILRDETTGTYMIHGDPTA